MGERAQSGAATRPEGIREDCQGRHTGLRQVPHCAASYHRHRLDPISGEEGGDEMTTEQAIKTERNKLLVVTVMEPKPVGDKGAIKYSAKVKAGEKEFILQTFSKIFGEYFKPGETLDAEYSVTTRENANDPEHPWIDRKVTQIFVDGKAVGGDKTGRQWRGDEKN